MGTNLGFGSGGGSGRPFTVQDLFAAVSPTKTSNGTQTGNHEVISTREYVALNDIVKYARYGSYGTVEGPNQVYNVAIWQTGIWG